MKMLAQTTAPRATPDPFKRPGGTRPTDENTGDPFMTSLASAPPLGAAVADIEPTYRKVFWRIVPFLMLCYVVAYLDRVNVGFAKLQMSQGIGSSETIYGLGAGLFFIGYFLFEVPSNMLLHRIGARVWIA